MTGLNRKEIMSLVFSFSSNKRSALPNINKKQMSCTTISFVRVAAFEFSPHLNWRLFLLCIWEWDLINNMNTEVAHDHFSLAGNWYLSWAPNHYKSYLLLWLAKPTSTSLTMLYNHIVGTKEINGGYWDCLKMAMADKRMPGSIESVSVPGYLIQ